MLELLLLGGAYYLATRENAAPASAPLAPSASDNAGLYHGIEDTIADSRQPVSLGGFPVFTGFTLEGLNEGDNAEKKQKSFAVNQLLALSYLKSVKLALASAKVQEFKSFDPDFVAKAGVITGEDIAEAVSLVNKYRKVGKQVGSLLPVVGEVVGDGIGALCGVIVSLIGEQLETNRQLDTLERERIKLRYLWFTLIRTLGAPPAALVHYCHHAHGGETMEPNNIERYRYRFDAVEFTRAMLSIIKLTETSFGPVLDFGDESVVPFYDAGTARKLWAKGELSLVGAQYLKSFEFDHDVYKVKKEVSHVEDVGKVVLTPLYLQYLFFPRLLFRNTGSKVGNATDAYIATVEKYKDDVNKWFVFTSADVSEMLKRLKRESPVLPLRVGHLPSGWSPDRREQRIASIRAVMYHLANHTFTTS